MRLLLPCLLTLLGCSSSPDGSAPIPLDAAMEARLSMAPPGPAETGPSPAQDAPGGATGAGGSPSPLADAGPVGAGGATVLVDAGRPPAESGPTFPSCDLDGHQCDGRGCDDSYRYECGPAGGSFVTVDCGGRCAGCSLDPIDSTVCGSLAPTFTRGYRGCSDAEPLKGCLPHPEVPGLTCCP